MLKTHDPQPRMGLNYGQGVYLISDACQTAYWEADIKRWGIATDSLTRQMTVAIDSNTVLNSGCYLFFECLG
jgi:hypothetical protein